MDGGCTAPGGDKPGGLGEEVECGCKERVDFVGLLDVAQRMDAVGEALMGDSCPWSCGCGGDRWFQSSGRRRH